MPVIRDADIIGLTGITDDMLKDAPQLKEALAEFLKFVDAAPWRPTTQSLTSASSGRLRKVGLDFQPTYVDS